MLASDAMSSEFDEHVAMAGLEEKRETGAALIVLGWAYGSWICS